MEQQQWYKLLCNLWIPSPYRGTWILAYIFFVYSKWESVWIVFRMNYRASLSNIEQELFTLFQKGTHRSMAQKINDNNNKKKWKKIVTKMGPKNEKLWLKVSLLEQTVYFWFEWLWFSFVFFLRFSWFILKPFFFSFLGCTMKMTFAEIRTRYTDLIWSFKS